MVMYGGQSYVSLRQSRVTILRQVVLDCIAKLVCGECVSELASTVVCDF